MMFPQVCITQKSSIGGVFDFFVVIFSLVFIGHLYQHLFLCSFILNHTSRLSSCKILLFLVCILKFPTWQDLPIFFFFFFFFSLALTFAQTTLLGFQPSRVPFFFFFFVPSFRLDYLFQVFNLSFFFFSFCLSSLD